MKTLHDVFISTIVVAAGNVLIPLLVINMLYTARMYREIFNLARLVMSADLANESWIDRLRLFLTASSAMSADEFDQAIKDIRSGNLKSDQAAKLASVILSKLPASGLPISFLFKLSFVRDSYAVMVGQWLRRSLFSMKSRQPAGNEHPEKSPLPEAPQPSDPALDR